MTKILQPLLALAGLLAMPALIRWGFESGAVSAMGTWVAESFIPVPD